MRACCRAAYNPSDQGLWGIWRFEPINVHNSSRQRPQPLFSLLGVFSSVWYHLVTAPASWKTLW